MHRYFALLLPLVVIAYSASTDFSDNFRHASAVARLWSTSVRARSYGSMEAIPGQEPVPRTLTTTTPALSALLSRLDEVEAGHDRDKIAQVCDAILLTQPTNYRAQMVLANQHFARQDYRKSAGDYARVLLNYPDDTAALSGDAWSAIKLGDMNRAVEDLATLLRIDPSYPRAQLGYSIATGASTEESASSF